MAAKLLTSAGGGIILDAASTATDKTITFPARTGNAAVDGPAFYATNGSTQSLSSGVFTKAQLSSETFDTNSAFNNTGSTVGSAPAYSFNPQVAGYYQFNTFFYYGSGSAFEQITQIYKNGSGYGNYASDIVGGISRATNGSKLVYLNGSTDYVELYVYINTAASVTSGNLEFQGFLVRGA